MEEQKQLSSNILHIKIKKNRKKFNKERYSVFQGFGKAKFAYGDSILSLSQFLILPQLPQKMKLTSKAVKIDPKIIVSISKI
jgi:hypothetical protein